MRVIIKEPGQLPRWRYIDNTLKALQEAVGGYIETVTVMEDVVMIVDEEGVLKGKKLNVIRGYPFAGTVVFAGVNGEDFDDCPILAMKALFGGPDA